MPERGEDQDRNRRPREVTATRPAERWRLREISGIFSPRRAFWELEQRRAQVEEDYDAEQAATLNFARYGLGLNKAGLLPKWWEEEVKAGKAPAELPVAAMAVVSAWRVAQSLFAGRRPPPRHLDDLENACARRERHRDLRRERDKRLAQKLRRLARAGDGDLAALAQELPARHVPDLFAPWWQVACWVRGIARAPAGLCQQLRQRFRLCPECGCVIALRKRKGQMRRFCDRDCRRRYARKKPAP